MDNRRKGLGSMTEKQVKEAYRYFVEHAYTDTTKSIAEHLSVSVSTINGMAKRLRGAGIDLPRGIRHSVLKDEDFLGELRTIQSEASSKVA